MDGRRRARDGRQQLRGPRRQTGDCRRRVLCVSVTRRRRGPPGAAKGLGATAGRGIAGRPRLGAPKRTCRAARRGLERARSVPAPHPRGGGAARHPPQGHGGRGGAGRHRAPLCGPAVAGCQSDPLPAGFQRRRPAADSLHGPSESRSPAGRANWRRRETPLRCCARREGGAAGRPSTGACGREAAVLGWEGASAEPAALLPRRLSRAAAVAAPGPRGDLPARASTSVRRIPRLGSRRRSPDRSASLESARPSLPGCTFSDVLAPEPGAAARSTLCGERPP